MQCRVGIHGCRNCIYDCKIYDSVVDLLMKLLAQFWYFGHVSKSLLAKFTTAMNPNPDKLFSEMFVWKVTWIQGLTSGRNFTTEHLSLVYIPNCQTEVAWHGRLLFHKHFSTTTGTPCALVNAWLPAHCPPPLLVVALPLSLPAANHTVSAKHGFSKWTERPKTERRRSRLTPISARHIHYVTVKPGCRQVSRLIHQI